MTKRWTAIAAMGLIATYAAPASAAPVEGMPNGAHYNLNLLGKNYCPGDDMKGGNRHTIFVKLRYSDADADPVLGNNKGNVTTLDKTNKIFLTAGPDFQVLDGNACDGDGARLQLPSDVATAWQVWIAEAGKPGKPGEPAEGDIRTCGISDSGTPTDPLDDEVVCSTENVILTRTTGKPQWRNETQALTTIEYYYNCTDTTEPIDVSTCSVTRINLFDDDFYQYFWDYDNDGLRLVKLRFFPTTR